MSVASEPAGDQSRELEEEQRLVEEAQRGNLDAMRPILERYAQPLYGTVILPRLGDTASAEEVLRDTLATAVEKINKFTWQGKSIYPWLRQIAINKVFDVHRQSKRSRRLEDESVPQHATHTSRCRARARNDRADRQVAAPGSNRYRPRGRPRIHRSMRWSLPRSRARRR